MLDPVFKPSFNFEAMVERLATLKLAFEPQALQWDFTDNLASEVVAGPFQRIETNGIVREDYDKYKLLGPASFGLRLAQLVDTLTWGIRLGCGRRSLYADWYPNDIEVHRYRPGSVAITSHRDYSCNRDMVAIVTVAGYAAFHCHGQTRDGRRQSYHTGPGSLALVDISQFHAVDPPLRGERPVIVMWMNPSLPTSSLSSRQ